MFTSHQDYDSHWLSRVTVPVFQARVLRGGSITNDHLVCVPSPQNLVASVSLSTPLSFAHMVTCFTSLSRENEKFPQLKQLVDFCYSCACVLAYEKGRVVINATRSLEETLRMLQFLRQELELIGPHVAVESFRIVNEVYNAAMPFHIDLHALHASRGAESSYTPRKFPGLIYKTPHGVRLLIFTSGRVVLAGVKRGESEANETLRRYYIMLAQHAITAEEAERRRRADNAIKYAEKRRKAEAARLARPPRAPKRKAAAKKPAKRKPSAKHNTTAVKRGADDSADGGDALYSKSSAKRALLEIMHAAPPQRANASSGIRFTGAKKTK